MSADREREGLTTALDVLASEEAVLAADRAVAVAEAAWLTAVARTAGALGGGSEGVESATKSSNESPDKSPDELSVGTVSAVCVGSATPN